MAKRPGAPTGPVFRVYIVDGEARLLKACRGGGKLSRGDGVIKHLRGVRPSNNLTTDEIMALMRGKS